MPYTVRSSEQTKKAASDNETKALLYLMNFREDSDEIQYFVVDFFNDLTGMDRFSEKLWDIQSKASKNNSPYAIGKELVTLYKNYVSEFDFAHYILFLGGVSSTVRIDDTLMTFDQSNITSKALAKIIEGLQTEARAKEYINNDDVSGEGINCFLDRVTFVVDDKKPSEYVRAIIKNHSRIIPEEQILDAIFNEIRNVQSGKKNTKVEGIVIQTSDEALNFCRHLSNSEIRLMTLQRIINRNPVEKNSIPPSFVPIYNMWAPESRRDQLDDCIQSLCRALFNKNAATQFWALFANIYMLIIANPTYGVQEIYQAIDPATKNASPDFDSISLKYFIATVKDGIQNDN